MEVTRSGVLGELGSFHLHGVGCRFELDTGEDVDVDWDLEGRAVFDSWRIWMYATSLESSPITKEDLRLAALRMDTVVALGPDKFTFPDRRYDLAMQAS